MIVVRTAMRLFGPFDSANAAMEWMRGAAHNLATAEHPMGIVFLTDPGIVFGPRRHMTDIHGNPVTLEQVDKAMNYKPRPTDVDWKA